MKNNNQKSKPIKVLTAKSEFKSDMDMVVTKNPGLGILNWGRKNQQPAYLLSLYKGQPQHAGIIKGKAEYLAGTDIKGNTPLANDFLKRANPTESWQEIRTKYLEDYTLYGGRAIKIVPNPLGVPLWFSHMDFGKIRISDCMTGVNYCDDWTNHFKCGVKDYPIWYPGCREVSVYLFRNYNPTVKKIESAYPGLEYESGLKDIDTLKRIQNSRNSLVINDFTSSVVITLFGGKPETLVEEQAIADRIKGNHTGDEETGKTIVLFADPGDKPADIQAVPTNGLDKKYLENTTAATNNVFACHKVPPELFRYIADNAPMFDKNKLADQNESFMNAYVIPNQKSDQDMIAMFYKLRTGQEAEFEIEQFDPIGRDLPLDNQAVVTALNTKDPNIIINWLDKKYNLNLPKTVDTSGNPIPVAQVNDHLKNLTGKQSQGIDRIVKKYQSGTYSEIQAILILKNSFGLTDADAKEFLGITKSLVPIAQRIAFARQVDFFALFDRYAHDVVEDDILEVQYLDRVQFSEDLPDPKTRTAILNTIKEDPEMPNEQIASIVGVSESVVASVVAWLVAKKLLQRISGALSITDKGQKAKKTVIYTEYNYDLRPDLKAKGQPLFISTSRQWCRDFYSKFGVGKKALTFDAIDAMSNEFGEDVWSYRGGWYGDEPFCRHGFVGTTKIRYE